MEDRTAGSVQLTSGEVHSWGVSLDVSAETYARLESTLACDERSRSARFRFERDRRRFIVARGALRELLARSLAISPGQIRFVYNAFGKPRLSPEFGNLRFNLSHSADLALVALARDAEIGVDVEYVRADAEYGEIARQFLSAAEVEQLNTTQPDLRMETFFRCWTRREACAKAAGEGFAMFDSPDEWSLYNLEPAPGYVGALAVARGDWRVRHWQWQC